MKISNGWIKKDIKIENFIQLIEKQSKQLYKNEWITLDFSSYSLRACLNKRITYLNEILIGVEPTGKYRETMDINTLYEITEFTLKEQERIINKINDLNDKKVNTSNFGYAQPIWISD